jgi:hypothetical protein
MSEHYRRTAHDLDPDEVPREAVEFDREIQFRQLVILGVSLVAITFLSGVVVFFMLRGFLRSEQRQAAPPPVVAPPQTEVPGPRLLARPEGELRRVREAEAATLGSYGWVDREGGVARVPIERAIEMIAAEGLPARAAATPAAPSAATAYPQSGFAPGAAPAAGAQPQPSQPPPADPGAEPQPQPTPSGASH